MGSIKNIIGYVLVIMIFPFCSSSRKNSGSGTEIIISSENKGLSSRNDSQTGTAEPASTVVLSASDLQRKYAAYLKTPPESITNIVLYQFIDRWLHTPYKWGGDSKTGIDCSAFMQRLYGDVYNIYIPRTSVDQFFADWIDRFASHTDLSEGDLVFFKTIKGTYVSHVGFYLGNRMFVNSSSSKGVSLGNLDDPYWKSKYVAAGRIKQGMIKKVRN